MRAKVRERKISFKRINNKWKTQDADNHSRTWVKARRGETITWEAEGTDLYFQFMDNKLFGDYTKTLKEGQRLSLTVGPNAVKGENKYAVFHYTDKEFVEGDSPPAIIVE